jgi:hypothetical protein
MSEGKFKPTQAMAGNARRGLLLREKFGRGGTEVGAARARQLSEQQELSVEDIRSMHSYFARHAVDKDTKTHQWGSDDDPSAGFVAWLLWGGDDGEEWAAKHSEALAH